MTEYERDLWERCGGGDEGAREELVLMHLRLVKMWASLIHRQIGRVDLELLMSAGNVGLLKAIGKFDYNRGFEFSTFAKKYIRGEIFGSPEVHRNMPRRPYEHYVQMMNAQERLAQRSDDKPTLAEIAEEAGLTLEQARNAQDARNIAFRVESIDQQRDQALDGDSGAASLDTTAAFEKAALDSEPKLADTYGGILEAAIRKLSQLESAIVITYYWGDETDAEVAERFGFTLTKTRKIRQRALAKLRRMLVEGSSNE